MSNRVFITGESGHLGSLLKDKFKELGHTVINERFEHFAQYNKAMIPNIFKSRYSNEIDFRDLDIIAYILGEASPDIIVHTAAYVGTDKCELDYYNAFMTNAYHLDRLIQCMNDIVPDCLFVNFSTTATMDPFYYGIEKKIDEQTVRGPKTWYGMTKWQGEQIVKNKCKKWINFLPVFLFNKFPLDNASIWAKMFIKSNCDETFDIKLDPNICKQYEYSDNLLDIIVKIIENKESIEYGDVILTGNEIKKFGEFLTIAEKIYEQKSGKKLRYELYPELDYLRDHIADNSLMLKLSGLSENQYNQQRKSFEIAIQEVVQSCL